MSLSVFRGLRVAWSLLYDKETPVSRGEIGPSFRFDLFQALQDHTTFDDLLIALEQAQRLGVLVPSVGGQEASFAFAHDLVRQTLLASMSIPRRQLLHARAAEALAQAHTATESQHAVMIA
jgi:predicted ATPase